ncbi:hypothetical protein MIR68_004137 [Amoeboaphelidium protococcarum]|nr:hypothetical protein MIR68_004137 [Amoeboaphelidium protococcarum]
MGRLRSRSKSVNKHDSLPQQLRVETNITRRGWASGYIAVAVLALILTFTAHYYNVPQWLNRRAQVELANIMQSAHSEQLAQIQGLADPVGSWNADGSFNDTAFMDQYVCNRNYKFGVNIMRRKPFMMYLSKILTRGESQHLIEAARPLFKRSTIVSDSDDTRISEIRTSSSAHLKRSHDKVVECIEERISMFVDKPVHNIEPLQVVWYREGQQYKPHYDWFDVAFPGADKELERGGQREITIFAYLNTVDMEKHGGATSFPQINVDVPAVVGDAAFWYNTDDNQVEDRATQHGGSPIIGNVEKYGLNVWIRQGEFI